LPLNLPPSNQAVIPTNPQSPRGKSQIIGGKLMIRSYYTSLKDYLNNKPLPPLPTESTTDDQKNALVRVFCLKPTFEFEFN
jgi:hypothetical protein